MNTRYIAVKVDDHIGNEVFEVRDTARYNKCSHVDITDKIQAVLHKIARRKMRKTPFFTADEIQRELLLALEVDE